MSHGLQYHSFQQLCIYKSHIILTWGVVTLWMSPGAYPPLPRDGGEREILRPPLPPPLPPPPAALHCPVQVHSSVTFWGGSGELLVITVSVAHTHQPGSVHVEFHSAGYCTITGNILFSHDLTHTEDLHVCMISDSVVSSEEPSSLPSVLSYWNTVSWVHSSLIHQS